MLVIFVLGFIAWAVPTVAAGWYLLTIREMHQELRLIRRYLQDAHERKLQSR